MVKLIIDQQLQWNEDSNACMLVTKFNDGSLLCEPLTPEAAAQWTAEHKF